MASGARAVAAVFAGCAAIVLWRSLQGHTYFPDDAYIYLRYAQNVLRGDGWVFNPGELNNTATSTGVVLSMLAHGVLFGVERLREDAELVSLAWMPVLGAATFAFLRPVGSWVALATAFTLVLTPHLYLTVGLPTAMQMSLVCLALLAYQRRSWAWLWLLLAALPIVRLENGLFVALVFLAAWLRDRRPLRSLVVPGILVALPLVAWLVFSWFYFGSLIPVSLAAKQWQTEVGHYGVSPVYLRILLGYVSLIVLPWAHLAGIEAKLVQDNPVAVLLEHPLVLVPVLAVALLVLVGVAARMRHGWPRAGALFMVWTLVHTLLYGVLLDAPGFNWYFSAIVFAAIWMLFEGVRALPGPTWARAVVLAALLGSFGAVALRELPIRDDRPQAYGQLAQWIDTNTPADAAIVHFEPGYLAYLGNRRIIDRWALTTPQYLPALRRGQRDFCWMRDLTGEAPVYYVSTEDRLPSPHVAAAFAPMMVYEDAPSRVRLFALEPSRFLLPDEGETSVFELDYALEGPFGRHFQTLLSPDGAHCTAAVALRTATRASVEPDPSGEGTRPVPAVAAGRLAVRFATPTRDYAAFAFDSAARMAPEAPSDGTKFTVRLRYADGTETESDGEHRPGGADDVGFTPFRFAIDPARGLTEIELEPHDADGIPDWWAVCNPVMVQR